MASDRNLTIKLTNTTQSNLKPLTTEAYIKTVTDRIIHLHVTICVAGTSGRNIII